MEVNPTICKLIVAGAVELIDKEPVFTKCFMDHVSHSLATHPSRGESADGWSSIIATFCSSLREANMRDLGIIMSLLAYQMSFNNIDDNSGNSMQVTDELDSYS